MYCTYVKGCMSLHHISVAGYCATLRSAFGTRGRHRRLVMHLMQCSEAIMTDSKLPFLLTYRVLLWLHIL